MNKRPQKVYRLNYWKADPEYAANVTVFGDPAEVRISASDSRFISVKNSGITLAPGMSGQVNIQGMSVNMRYGGLLADLPFPLSIMPTTMASPFPKQIMIPPLLSQLPTIAQLAVVASSFVGL